MLARISAGIGDHLWFLTFYYLWSLLTTKLQNFPHTCCLFLKDYHNYFLVRAQLLINGKPVSQYVSCSLIFNPLRSVINGEQHEKYWSRCTVSLCFISFLCSLCWVKFQAENDLRSAPASSALSLVSHQSHNVLTANRHLRGSRERNGT